MYHQQWYKIQGRTFQWAEQTGRPYFYTSTRNARDRCSPVLAVIYRWCDTSSALRPHEPEVVSAVFIFESAQKHNVRGSIHGETYGPADVIISHLPVLCDAAVSMTHRQSSGECRFVLHPP